MLHPPTVGPALVRTPQHRSRTARYRAAVIVTATTALTTATLGLAAPAGAAPGPASSPAYTTSTIPVADLPTRVAIDQSAHTAYVTSPKYAPQGTLAPNGTVTVIDLTTNRVTDTIEVGPLPSGVAIDEANHRVYVANQGTQGIIGPPIGNTVSVIDTTTNAVTGTVAIESSPDAVAVDHRTHRIYVTSRYGTGVDNGVAVIDPATSQVSATIPLERPEGIAIDEETDTAYVSASGFGTCFCQGVVWAINLTSKQANSILVGPVPSGVAVDQATHRAYVADTGYTQEDGRHIGSGVSVIDTTTNNVIETITVGDSPIGVAVDSGAGTAYITRGNGTVAVVDTTTNRLAGTVGVGGHPSGVAVDPGTHNAQVANGLGNGHGAIVVLQRSGNTQPTATSVGAINPVVGASTVLFAAVSPGTAGGAVAFSDGTSPIDGCGSRPIVFGYALCFTSFATTGQHVITGMYLGDNAHAPSSVSVPLGVGQADPFQAFLGQVIDVARVILAVLVPSEGLSFGF